MLQSMTGFAVKESELLISSAKKVHITISLKTLNGRYFEASCKLPLLLSHLETDSIKKLKHHLIRGSVYLTVYISSGSTIQTEIKPALNVIGQYITALEEAQNAWNIPGTLSITELVRLPNIFETREPLLDQETRANFMILLDELIEEVKKARFTDGSALKEDLLKRIEIITELMHLIEPRAEMVMEQKKNEFLKLLKEAQSSTGLNETSMAGMVYTTLDKIDIHEEITRFKSLLKQLKSIINTEEVELGKKIDFTLQELFREINTLGAKCSDTHISQHAINIKVELEKAREVTQNIL